MSELNTNYMFPIALEIVTILQSKPIDSKDERAVLQMVKGMLAFRDNYGSISLSPAPNKKAK